MEDKIQSIFNDILKIINEQNLEIQRLKQIENAYNDLIRKEIILNEFKLLGLEPDNIREWTKWMHKENLKRSSLDINPDDIEELNNNYKL